MNFTNYVGQTPEDSGCVSGSFEQSSLFESTPVASSFMRKRRHEDKSRFCNTTIPSPRYSSTLNESQVDEYLRYELEHSVKIQHSSLTPDKQQQGFGESFLKGYVCSPVQEQYGILYGKIKTNTPKRKCLTPKKLNQLYYNSKEAESTKCLEKVFQNNVIMSVIFSYLSDGDLYRFSKVSKLCHRSVLDNIVAARRFERFVVTYKDNKENYVCTPPSSPEKSNSPTHSDSPPYTTDNSKIGLFFQMGKQLTGNQTLRLCDNCQKPCIVEKNISQCQNVATCGIISCLICGSSSTTGPEHFSDYCGRSRLQLTEISNLSSNHDSGISSEGEGSPRKVRRNLFKESSGEGLCLVDHNRIQVASTSQKHQKKRPSVSYVPVISNDNPRQRVLDSPSPPRLIGSAQSKKNLRRLTR